MSAGVVTRHVQKARRMSARPIYPLPADAALLTPISLARRQDTLSTGKLANFLPVGKDFTIPARDFLPVGNGAARLAGDGDKTSRWPETPDTNVVRPFYVNVDCCRVLRPKARNATANSSVNSR